MSAEHFELDNLIAVIDDNKMQSDGKSKEILDMYNLPSKWQSFGWDVVEVNGHDIKALYDAFTVSHQGKPLVVIAHTIKGKGISFMEGNIDWHHGQLTKSLYEKAIQELEVIES